MVKNLRVKINNFYSSHRIASVVIVYTIFWLVLASLILFIFDKNEKVFFWVSDGVYQHFSSFNYLCDYLKDLVYNFHFSGFFNYTLGQGMDILTTLNSYDFTDPICILCALIFPLSRVARYTLMIFIKLYLIGIAFLFYCYAIERKQGLATVAGAVSFVFCGAVLFMFARHPNYINWAYFLPFLLGGVELYFRKKKKLPLIIFVFLNLITSYYTFYMNVILTVIYVVVHVICKVAKDKKISTLKEELIKCLKLTGVCCIGVLLSAFVLFPTIYTYLNNSRVGELTGAVQYGDEYYKNIFEDLFAPLKDEAYTGVVGFNVVLIIPLALIFTKRKQYTAIKSLFIISLIMLGIPMAGRILNGFGYATNRWAYVLPFYASVILVFMFTEIGAMSDKEKLFVYLVVIIYVILCYLRTDTNTNGQKTATLVMLIAVVAIVGISLHYRYPYIEPLLLSLVILGSCFQVYFTFSEYEGNYVDTFLDEKKVTSSYKNYSSTAAADLSDDDFYRIETEEAKTANINGRNHVNGTEFWWSTVSGDTMDYYIDLALDSVSNNCCAFGLDGRSGLLELAGVKYYTRPAKDEGLVPYGYEEIESPNEKYQVYENQYALPLGYTYSSFITSSEYNAMNGIEKEQALLQAAVLEDDIAGISKAEPTLDYEILNYKTTKEEGMELTDHSIKVTDTSGEVDFQVDVPDDCEIYVYITGIELEDNVKYANLYATRNSDGCSIRKRSRVSNLTFNWPVMRDDLAFNLGSGYSGKNIITLTADTKATFTFDKIQIIAVPMDAYTQCARELGEYVLEDVEVGDDQINGSISLPEERILQMAVPYSEGWKAYVDGEEVPVMKSDVMYMAILVSAGEHFIEFRYETPYLRLGIMVSIATALLFAAYEIIRWRKVKSKGVRKDGK